MTLGDGDGRQLSQYKNPANIKAVHKYRKARAERVRAQSKQYVENHKVFCAQFRRDYHLRFHRTTGQYHGSDVCPKCGKAGFLYSLEMRNINTKKTYPKYYHMRHDHWAHGRKYSSRCQLGYNIKLVNE